MNRNVVKLAGLIFGAFAVVIIYLTYIQVWRSHDLLNHPRNRRLQALEASIHRGRILDHRGRVLAETILTGQGRKRVYPFGDMAAAITGYLSATYGRAGLEAAYNEELLGLDNRPGPEDFWALNSLGRNRRGNDLVLSIDMNLQQLAYRLLGARKGAVVAVEPATGRVLAMVSRPGFNPQDIETEWDVLQRNPDSLLLNRAAQGLYPPGSIMKVITAAGILARRPETAGRVFDAPGYIVIDGRRIEDAQARGRISLAQAMARSSNYVFALLGLEQGAANLVATARSFGLGQEVPFDLPAEKGRLPNPEQLSRLELGESAIGQGRVMVTPLNMALVAAGVANDGRIMVPTLVDEIRSPGGAAVHITQPREWLAPVSGSLARQLRSLLVTAVAEGTGTEAVIPGVSVAGKTGSAQNPHGQAHAWFIGFAPADRPLVAVAVIVENGGAGGRTAAPIAREIMKTVIGQKR